MQKTNKEIAHQLNEVYTTQTPCEPITQYMQKPNMESAYAIQEINTLEWINKGRKAVGCKIGLTSPSVQKQLGVDQPDFGILYQDMLYRDGQQIPISKLLQPKVEAEIAIVLKADLKKENLTIDDIMSAADYALPAIEIVDSRIANWEISLFDTIADNASSALYAVGEYPAAMDQVDWENCQMKLYNHGGIVSQGQGQDCMGNPLIAAAWLANRMVKQNRPLLAGDIILTGALGPMFSIEGGEEIRTEITSVGSLTISFTKRKINV